MGWFAELIIINGQRGSPTMTSLASSEIRSLCWSDGIRERTPEVETLSGDNAEDEPIPEGTSEINLFYHFFRESILTES